MGGGQLVGCMEPVKTFVVGGEETIDTVFSRKKIDLNFNIKIDKQFLFSRFYPFSFAFLCVPFHPQTGFFLLKMSEFEITAFLFKLEREKS